MARRASIISPIRAIRVRNKDLASLDRSDDFAGLHAFGADSQSLCGAVMHNANALQIRQPSAFCLRSAKRPRTGVLVTDVLSKLRAFAAGITSVSHVM